MRVADLTTGVWNIYIVLYGESKVEDLGFQSHVLLNKWSSGSTHICTQPYVSVLIKFTYWTREKWSDFLAYWAWELQLWVPKILGMQSERYFCLFVYLQRRKNIGEIKTYWRPGILFLNSCLNLRHGTILRNVLFDSLNKLICHIDKKWLTF